MPKNKTLSGLRPGERLIDGEIYYSAAWLDDNVIRPITEMIDLVSDRQEDVAGTQLLFFFECNSAPEDNDDTEGGRAA